MLNLDPAKLLVILVLGLVVVGPEKLPSLARQLSGAWRTVTKYRAQLEGEIRRAMPDLDLPQLPTNPSAMLSRFVSDLIRQPNVEREGATSSAESRGTSTVSSHELGRASSDDDPGMN
jgi:Sec-independent protein translocase protein TatA